MPEFQRFYYELKAYNVITSFSKELHLRMNDISSHQVESSTSSAKNLNIFQIIPQDLQGTLFFKAVQQILKKSGPENKD